MSVLRLTEDGNFENGALMKMRELLLFDIAFVPFRKKRSPEVVFVVTLVLLVDIHSSQRI